MTDNKYLNDAAKLLTAQSREINALKRDIISLEESNAKLKNLIVAALRWHFAEGGSAPELFTDEIDSTVPPTEIPFRREEQNGVTVIIQTGAVLR